MTTRALRTLALIAALFAVLAGCNNGGSSGGSAAPPANGSAAPPAQSSPASKGNY